MGVCYIFHISWLSSSNVSRHWEVIGITKYALTTKESGLTTPHLQVWNDALSISNCSSLPSQWHCQGKLKPWQQCLVQSRVFHTLSKSRRHQNSSTKAVSFPENLPDEKKNINTNKSFGANKSGGSRQVTSFFGNYSPARYLILSACPSPFAFYIFCVGFSFLSFTGSNGSKGLLKSP